jgi:hypothetical protein
MTAVVDVETGEVMEIPSTELEGRAGIRSLDALHAERRQLLNILAPLQALHGAGDLWDAKRKQLLEALKVRQRLTLLEQGQKVTEGLVDAMAYADAQYATFLDQGERDRIEYITLRNRYNEIEEQIRDREFSLLAYNSEIKLAR